MNPELVLGTIQSVLAMLGVGIAAVQLFQQWPRRQTQVRMVCPYV
jgi:hypothetical protein